MCFLLEYPQHYKNTLMSLAHLQNTFNKWNYLYKYPDLVRHNFRAQPLQYFNILICIYWRYLMSKFVVEFPFNGLKGQICKSLILESSTTSTAAPWRTSRRSSSSRHAGETGRTLGSWWVRTWRCLASVLIVYWSFVDVFISYWS